MITPNFLLDEFVNASIFDNAMSQLVNSMRETGANDTFIIPGVINPSGLIITTNGTLQVSTSTPNTGVTAFKCFFQTGAITAGFGMVNGITSSTYTVNFAPLIPITGSITGYIVAQYAQIQEAPITVIGPPPGHPDYSANFVPYIGYVQLQDTLNIFATTTPPDNQLTIELARTTLVAGQTQVITLDTSHQVLAQVNVNTTLVGDVTGPITNNRISNLQGNPVSANSPGVNNALVWNGSNWVPVALPTTLPPSGPAGGDLIGAYPNPQVLRSSVVTFTANAIAANGSIGSTANITAGGNIAAVGNLIGAPAALGNEAIILSQFGNIGAIAPINPTTAGDIYHQSYTLPILFGGVLAYLIVNFGFYCFYGLTAPAVENQSVSVTYAQPFTRGAITVSTNFATNDFTDTGSGAFKDAGIFIETPILNGPGNPLTGTAFYLDSLVSGTIGSVITIAGPTKVGLLGFWWSITGV